MPTMIKTSFNAGEISPRTTGRIDIGKYTAAVAEMLNFIAMPQGPAIRRSGTYWVAETKDSSKESRLLKFEYNVEQAYLIEVGDQYMRFYSSAGQILGGQLVLNGSFEYETTPPTPDDWTTINTPAAWVKDTTRFIMPEGSGKLTTTAGGAGGIRSAAFTTVNGQDYEFVLYLFTADAGVEVDITIRNGAASGDNIALTGVALAQNAWTEISGTFTEANQGSGAYIEIDTSAPASTVNWFVDNVQIGPVDLICEIASPYTEAEIWDCYITQTNDIAYIFHPNYPIRKLVRFADDWWELLTPTISDQPTKWNDSAGYPACGTFHQQRLWCGGVPAYPQWLWASKIGAFEDFDLGTGADNDAIEVELSSASANVIRWITASRKLNLGTSGGEWWLGATATETITPGDKTAHLDSVTGSAPIKPLLLGNSVIFIQRSGKTVREMTYKYTEDAYDTIDHTVLSEHLLAANFVVDVDLMFTPHNIIWAVRDDGAAIAMTHMKQEEVYGWHVHVLGGVSDTIGTQAQIESVRCIPAEGDDEVWVIVKRLVDGTVKRYVEKLTPLFKNPESTDEAFFIDSGLALDNREDILSVTKGATTIVELEEDGVVEDNFDSGLATGWNNGPGAFDPITTSGGKAVGSVAASINLAYWDAAEFDEDQFSEAVLNGLFASGGEVNLIIKFNGTLGIMANLYEDWDQIYLFDTDYTYYGETPAGFFQNGDTIRIESEGTIARIISYRSGAIHAVWEYDLGVNMPSGGAPGLGFYDNLTTSNADNWRGGNRAHGISNGDELRIRCVGLEHPDDENENLHFRPVKVANAAGSQFEITELDDTSIDTTNHTDFVEGTVGVMVNYVFGLDHLEGEEVQVFSDGGVDAPQTVQSGAITLQSKGSVIAVGLGFTSRLKTLPPVLEEETNTYQGETKRYTHALLRLHNTIGGEIGPALDRMEIIQMVDDSIPLGQPPALFTGDTDWYGVEGGYERSPAIFIQQDQPYPITVVALLARVELS